MENVGLLILKLVLNLSLYRIYTELALSGNKNECARTDTAFSFFISEFCDGTLHMTHCKLAHHSESQNLATSTSLKSQCLPCIFSFSSTFFLLPFMLFK